MTKHRKLFIGLGCAVALLAASETLRYVHFLGAVDGFKDGAFWGHEARGTEMLADSCREWVGAYDKAWEKDHNEQQIMAERMKIDDERMRSIIDKRSKIKDDDYVAILKFADANDYANPPPYDYGRMGVNCDKMLNVANSEMSPKASFQWVPFII